MFLMFYVDIYPNSVTEFCPSTVHPNPEVNTIRSRAFSLSNIFIVVSFNRSVPQLTADSPRDVWRRFVASRRRLIESAKRAKESWRDDVELVEPSGVLDGVLRSKLHMVKGRSLSTWALVLPVCKVGLQQWRLRPLYRRRDKEYVPTKDESFPSKTEVACFGSWRLPKSQSPFVGWGGSGVK